MHIVFERFASECCCRCSGSDARVFRSLATDVWAMRTFKGLGSVENRLGFVDVLLDAHSVKHPYVVSMWFVDFQNVLYMQRNTQIPLHVAGSQAETQTPLHVATCKPKRRFRYMWPLASWNADSDWQRESGGGWEGEGQIPLHVAPRKPKRRFRYMWPLTI